MFLYHFCLLAFPTLLLGLRKQHIIYFILHSETPMPHYDNCYQEPMLPFIIIITTNLEKRKTQTQVRAGKASEIFPDQYPPNKGMEVQRTQIAQRYIWPVHGKSRSRTHGLWLLGRSSFH